MRFVNAKNEIYFRFQTLDSKLNFGCERWIELFDRFKRFACKWNSKVIQNERKFQVLWLWNLTVRPFGRKLNPHLECLPLIVCTLAGSNEIIPQHSQQIPLDRARVP